jgi:hypothetical protein
MSKRPPTTAKDREQRNARIIASVRGGSSYSDIGRAESLSPERVRQIIVQEFREERSGTRVDPAMLQLARLAPALRVAALAVEAGDVSAIAPFLKILTHWDRYNAAANMQTSEGEDVRRRLLVKLNRVASRMQDDRETKALEASARETSTENLEETE